MRKTSPAKFFPSKVNLLCVVLKKLICHGSRWPPDPAAEFYPLAVGITLMRMVSITPPAASPGSTNLVLLCDDFTILQLTGEQENIQTPYREAPGPGIEPATFLLWSNTADHWSVQQCCRQHPVTEWWKIISNEVFSEDCFFFRIDDNPVL